MKSFSNNLLLRKHCKKYFLLLLAFLLVLYLLRHFRTKSANHTNENGTPKLITLTSEEEKRMISLIRGHLTPPAPQDERYNLSVRYRHYGEHDSYHKTLVKLLEKYGKRNGGFFVEAGALDGHYLSHTLDLEMGRAWTGLLVEASPNLTQQLRSKRRKCWSADVCLSEVPHMRIDYLAKKKQKAVWERGNGKVNPDESGVTPKHYENRTAYVSEGMVDCFSLDLLLKALNVKRVDLLVLDIEGLEYKVLSTYPFHKIPIKMVAVEHWLMPEAPSKLREFMEKMGYLLVFESKSDFVFALVEN